MNLKPRFWFLFPGFIGYQVIKVKVKILACIEIQLLKAGLGCILMYKTLLDA